MVHLSQELAGHFQITQSSEGVREIALHIPAGLSYLAGHFPQMPIVPGVGIVNISQFLVSEKFPGALAKVQSFRIKNPVQAGEQVKILIREIAEENAVHFHWKCAADEAKTFAELSLQWQR
jgi:3-hydroxymyristoyl/3-hydroxydecanoyl-(acyl carrier protein) dehydratase